MSVSLRVKVLELLSDFGSGSPSVKMSEVYADKILALFPIPLTEEEIEILKVIECIPDLTIKQRRVIDKVIHALATPTFSGGTIPNVGLRTPDITTEQKEYCECICPVKLNSDICANCHKEIRMGKPIPAEKKEHQAHCGFPITDCSCKPEKKCVCGKPNTLGVIHRKDKPCYIPETNTCDFNMCGRCMRVYPNDYECKAVCNNYEPEPTPPNQLEPEPLNKPADRIKPLNDNCSKDQLFWNVKHKVEELIRHINKES